MGKRLAKEQRRQQIIDTTIRLFADTGFRGTTTKRIAAAAGVSEATVFLHFTSKEGLYHAILEDAIKAQEPLLQELSSDSDLPLAELLRRAAKATLNRNRRDKAMLRLLFYSALEEHSLGKKFFRQQMRGPFRELAKLLDHHLRHKPNQSVNVDVAARAFVGMMLYEIIAPELFGVGRKSRGSVDQLVQEFVDNYLNGVLPSKARRRDAK